jgi:disulfide bond formation protein DsbB
MTSRDPVSGADPLARVPWLAGAPRLRRVLTLVLALAALGAMVGFAVAWPVGAVRKVVGLERVTIQVDSCPTTVEKNPSSCVGNWRLRDGVSYSGPISGTGRGDTGKALRGWGNTHSASTERWILAMNVVITLVPLASLMFAAVMLFRLVLRVRRAV